MCLFRKSEFKEHKKYNILVAAGIGIIFLALIFAFAVNPSENLMPGFTLAQLTFSALAFILLIIALCYTANQLQINLQQYRKMMAKPRIKVAFNEQGEQQATLTCRDGALSGQRQLWLTNEGNAISRYFQIDFIIPENIGKQSTYIPIGRRDGKYVVSNTNDGRYTLFVNRPHFDPNIIFWAAIDTKKCIEVDSFEIEYRIYGDWAETQEGKLKVICKKK